MTEPVIDLDRHGDRLLLCGYLARCAWRVLCGDVDRVIAMCAAVLVEATPFSPPLRARAEESPWSGLRLVADYWSGRCLAEAALHTRRNGTARSECDV